MLVDVIANYVDSLTEREFDPPFMALLRISGFTDIHFLHGTFEFGKDFIAKRLDAGVTYQYAFQTKAGDIALGDWNQCRGQIDLLRTDALAHPNFDASLPRRAIFVTTGRLVGGASLAAQSYRQHLDALGESKFLTWDRDTIIEMLASSPGCLNDLSPALLHILGAQKNHLNFTALENYSRSWIRSECSALSLRDVLEASLIAQHCRKENRIDLASYLSLMLIRSLWATVHGAAPLPELAKVALIAGRDLFRNYALQLWQLCDGEYLDRDTILRVGQPAAGLVTYPVRCLTVVEILAMLGILEKDRTPEVSKKVGDYLAKFVIENVGASHPISDRWGVSLACCTLLLALRRESDSLRSYLRSAIKWIGDKYDDDNLGLAGPHSAPDEETNYLLGSPFEHIRLNRRPESYIATLILDLCAVLGEKELFELARNEFLAVNVCLPVLEVDDGPEQYSIDSTGQRYEPNMPYLEHFNPTGGWKAAPHHERGPDFRYPESMGDTWDQIAISCVLRDRHFVKSWRRLITPRILEPASEGGTIAR
jgi:hypothetical protein